MIRALIRYLTRGADERERDAALHQYHQQIANGAALDSGDISTDEYHEVAWADLHPFLRHLAVAHLRGMLDTEAAREICESYEADPLSWWAPYHFFAGMALRNHLRAAIPDASLPTGNWDDYYVRAVEAAIGVKPV